MFVPLESVTLLSFFEHDLANQVVVRYLRSIIAPRYSNHKDFLFLLSQTQATMLHLKRKCHICKCVCYYKKTLKPFSATFQRLPLFCHRPFRGAPSTRWLAIPAAALTLYSCLLQLLQPALGTSLLYLFLGKSIPTFHVHMVLFPSFSKAFHGTPFAP